MQPRNPKESGIVLLTVLLLMLILSAIMAGFFFTVLGEQQVVRSGRDNVVAFYGAEGGLEQLSAGLAQLFESTASPAIAQINALSTPTYTPPQVTYPTYTVGCPDAQPFQGIYSIRFSWPIFLQWRRDHRFCMPFVALVSSWDRADVSCTVAG